MNRIYLLLICSFVTTVQSATKTNEQGKFYDCSANSLYLYCGLTDNRISYSRSIELLPITDKGNSMAEMNSALQRCGYETNAKIIKTEDLAKVNTPSIV